ncbi:hypothetical protein HPP92_029136 [Vanilla planifolia]|uniref:Uncharacterized protein n=1 Tax=Vanilla planifolia TaxID=51239 RepID=A0A835P2W4_VANPL|nr:hypothetical protein HPP92_029136 [Vanilla planifolia]KAG0445855.1 hypothetical protein HPP92_029125 [Vanilla planifolia]
MGLKAFTSSSQSLPQPTSRHPQPVVTCGGSWSCGVSGEETIARRKRCRAQGKKIGTSSAKQATQFSLSSFEDGDSFNKGILDSKP